RAEEQLQIDEGWFPRGDRERRRFWEQKRRAEGDGNDDHAIRRMGPERQGRICAGTEGATVCGHDRRIHKDHARREQRRVRKRLAAWRPEDRRNRATRTWIESLQIVEDQGRRTRRVELGAGPESAQSRCAGV